MDARRHHGAGRVRIRASGDAALQDRSANLLAVGVAGHDYYVNDASIAGDRFTTGAGDNARSGTTPADPVRSIYTLITTYDLGPGDTVHVDSGDYLVPINIRLAAEDGGVVIEGPGDGAVARLDRRTTFGRRLKEASCCLEFQPGRPF